MTDRNFDDLYERLNRRVYSRQGGEIRLQTLWRDLAESCPQIEASGLKVLDAGGGLGQFSQLLAQKGHQITYIDLSEKMMKEAKLRISESGYQDNILFLHGSFQELGEDHYEAYDLVLSHGVIAWLAEPQKAIGALKRYMKPQGFLSLLFYNKDRLILKKGAAGQLFDILNDSWKKPAKDKSLTPTNPLLEKDVRQWLAQEDLEILSKGGIRIFESLYRRVDLSDRLQELAQAEWKFCRREPYASIAQHIHLVCRKVS